MALSRRPGEQELAESTKLLDRYSILDRIGAGGMATIYRATDERLDRVVCIKLLRTTLVEGSSSDNTGGRAVYRATYSHFLQEALALSKLQHPNTLRIYDFGYLDANSPDPGAPFHVSEYLDGGNLETHLKLRGALSTEETLNILEGITEALAEAHEHGIIHRDIKPSNILFARVRGELVPKLADFGIAYSDLKPKAPGGPKAQGGAAAGKAIDLDSASVGSVALFSPRWAAPEQLCGAPEGPHTDVYALGLVAAFMLTGRVIFCDDDVRITFNDRVRSDDLMRARLAPMAFPNELEAVLLRATSARPRDRLATAPAFFEALRSVLTQAAPQVASRPGDDGTAMTASRKKLLSGAVDAPFSSSSISSSVESAQQGTKGLGAFPMHLPAPARLRPEVSAPPVPTRTHPSAMALALEVVAPVARGKPHGHPAHEQVAHVGSYRVRVTDVLETIDLSFIDTQGAPVRVRVTMLPALASDAQPKLNVKGLTCFIACPGQRPTLALNVTQDGSAELVSAARQPLAELAWFFGSMTATAEGRVFVVDGQRLLIPLEPHRAAIALLLRPGRDLVVMCQR